MERLPNSFDLKIGELKGIIDGFKDDSLRLYFRDEPSFLRALGLSWNMKRLVEFYEDVREITEKK